MTRLGRIGLAALVVVCATAAEPAAQKPREALKPFNDLIGSWRGTATPANLVMTAAVPLADARRIWVTDGQNRVVLDEKLPAAA